MSAMTVWREGIRLVGVTLVYLIGFVVSALLLGPPTPEGSDSAPPGQLFGALLAVALLNTAVIAWIVGRAACAGRTLTAALAFSFYGVHTLMPQSDAAVFPAVLARMPPGTIRGTLLMGLLLTAVYIPVAVLTLRPPGAPPASIESAVPRSTRRAALMGKIFLSATLYVAIYFVFGYYVAWRNPAVPAYYGGVDPGSFLLQLRAMATSMPWLPAFQLLRGLLWVALALPVIWALRRGRAETTLAVGALFAVVMSSTLLLPNPFMPDGVRSAHLAETASSNLLFGCVLGWLFHGTPAPWRVRLAPASTAPAAPTP